jgi:type I restriction enzyme, R subunit
MPVSTATSSHPDDADSGIIREDHIEYGFIGKLQGLKYEYRPDITNRATLEKNFREKFEALNRVHLTDAEFARLLDEIVVADVYTASKYFANNNIRHPALNAHDLAKNAFLLTSEMELSLVA